MKRKFHIFLSFLLAFLLMTTVAFAGAGSGGISPYTIFGDDDRVAVNSTSGSNLAICKMYISYDDGSYGYGTGFLIDSTTVVTAGHCLHAEKSNGTAKDAVSVVCYFGCSGSNASHTYAASRSITCTDENTYWPSSWDTFNANYDYGVLKLSSAYTSPSSYFNLSTISSPEGKTVTITGYEHHSYNTAFSNWQLLRGTGEITDSTTYRLRGQIDAMPGQSGSPVVYNGNVVGIYTYGANAGDFITNPTDSNFNTMTRLTSSAINNIEGF